eukprot:g29124.t1
MDDLAAALEGVQFAPDPIQPVPAPAPALPDPAPADPAPADPAPRPIVAPPVGWINFANIHAEEWINNRKCVMVPRDFILSKKSVIAFDFKSDIRNHIRREEAKENDFFFRVVDVDSTIKRPRNEQLFLVAVGGPDEVIIFKFTYRD